MRFTRNVAEYTIDLAEDEDSRWAEVIEQEASVARKLVDEAMSGVVVSAGLLKPAAWVFERLYRNLGGRYCREIEAWAAGLGITRGEATGLSCSYEINHLWEWLSGMRLPKIGCTAGVRWLPGRGLIHVRTLDWDLPSMGAATRIFKFQDGGHSFVAVGLAGFVGVLSGMVPGQYSVSINWAPPGKRRPTFDFGPALLLREVLASIDDYDEAVEVLSTARLAAPAFFMVCGVHKRQACVIERQQNSAVIRRIRNGILIQTNHHVARKYQSANGYWDRDADDTWQRADTLRESLLRLKQGTSLRSMGRCLQPAPVTNESTGQRMLFCPKTGELEVWRRT